MKIATKTEKNKIREMSVRQKESAHKFFLLQNEEK